MCVRAVGAGIEPTTLMPDEQDERGHAVTPLLRKSGNRAGTRTMILPWNWSRKLSSRRRWTRRFPSDIRRRVVDHHRTDTYSARACLPSLRIAMGTHATSLHEVGAGTQWRSYAEKLGIFLRHR